MVTLHKITNTTSKNKLEGKAVNAELERLKVLCGLSPVTLVELPEVGFGLKRRSFLVEGSLLRELDAKRLIEAAPQVHQTMKVTDGSGVESGKTVTVISQEEFAAGEKVDGWYDSPITRGWIPVRLADNTVTKYPRNRLRPTSSLTEGPRFDKFKRGMAAAGIAGSMMAGGHANAASDWHPSEVPSMVQQRVPTSPQLREPTDVEPQLADPTDAKPQLAEPTKPQLREPTDDVKPQLREPTEVQPRKLADESADTNMTRGTIHGYTIELPEGWTVVDSEVLVNAEYPDWEISIFENTGVEPGGLYTGPFAASQHNHFLEQKFNTLDQVLHALRWIYPVNGVRSK